jgi:hypothetical protein
MFRVCLSHIFELHSFSFFNLIFLEVEGVSSVLLFGATPRNNKVIVDGSRVRGVKNSGNRACNHVRGV